MPFPSSPDEGVVHTIGVRKWIFNGTEWESLSSGHDAVTLAGAPDYLTLAGQVLTRALINLASHVTGVLPAANIDTAIARLGSEDQVMSGGARVTVKDLGNLNGATITPDPGDRPVQKITNNGAGTIAPGSNYGSYILIVKNTTGAGAITTSGWQSVKGDAFDTTTTSEFVCHCVVTADLSSMIVVKAA
jgi:hypothetical protein